MNNASSRVAQEQLNLLIFRLIFLAHPNPSLADDAFLLGQGECQSL
jgi:hypothetical protein